MLVRSKENHRNRYIFNYCSTVQLKTVQSTRKFLEYTDGNFLTQVIKELTRGDTLLNLTLMNKVEIVGDMAAGANLSSCVHEMVGLRILRREHGRKRAYNPGHQEGRPGPVQGLVWKDAVGNSSVEKCGSRTHRFSTVSSSELKNGPS